MISRIFTVLIVVFTFISCSSDEDGLSNELNRNRQQWASKNIEDYKWNESYTCGCLGLVFERDIFVIDKVKDKVVFDASVLPANVSFEAVYEQVLNDSKTVEEAFDYIESLLTEEIESLIIEYDELYGFPTIISVDYVVNIADDEISYFYTNFSKEN